MKLQKKLLGTAVAAMLALSACSSQPTTPVAPTGESGPENTAELQTEAKANEGTDNEVLETPEKVKEKPWRLKILIRTAGLTLTGQMIIKSQNTGLTRIFIIWNQTKR